MLTVLGSPWRTQHGLTRRQALCAGGLSLTGGFTLPQLLAAEASRPSARPRRARSVILLYLLGGAATQDMVDLKPDAPTGIKSDFRPMATRVPGFQVCEHLPRLAQWTHKIALVRSLNHAAGCHNTLPGYTGRDGVLPDIVSTRDTYPPSMGSVCEWLRHQEGGPRAARELPDYVYMPCHLGWGQAIHRPGPYGGFLGKRFDPLYTEVSPTRDPALPAPAPGRPLPVLGAPRLPDSTLAEGITPERLTSRRGLVRQIEDQMRGLESSGALNQFGRTQHRAYNILTSSEVRAAFDLTHEAPAVRDRYGRTLFGNCSLIARRLVESGVRFVNVTWDLFWDRVPINYDAWDTHTRNFPILQEVNLPEFDRVYSALLEDLEARGR